MSEITPSSKPFRRVRKHIGAKWKPQKDQVLVTQGPYCPACRIRHGYKDKKNLKTQYELYDGKWRILWVCGVTGTVIEYKVL